MTAFTSTRNLIGEELFVINRNGTNLTQRTHALGPLHAKMGFLASHRILGVSKRKIDYHMAHNETETLAYVTMAEFPTNAKLEQIPK